MAKGTITDGDLLKPLFRLAAPIIAIQMLQIFYNLTDTFWLGRLSTEAVGAVSIVVPLLLVLFGVAGGLATAGSILVSQHTGADNTTASARIAGQSIVVIQLAALVLAVAGVVGVGPMLELLPGQTETTETVIPLAEEYLTILFSGLPFLFGFTAFAAIMRGYGDTYTPMKVMVVSVALNFVLDPVLIFGFELIPAMGISGSALATVIARGSGTAIGLYILFFTSTGPSIGPADLLPRLSDLRDLVEHGMPLVAERASTELALVVQMAVVVTFAPSVVAAYGIGNRFMSIVFLFGIGLSRAINTVVGQNLGAENVARAERAVKLALSIGAGLMVCIGALIAIFASPLIQVFIPPSTPDAAATIDYGIEYLRITAFAFLFIPMVDILLGAFRGAGNTRTALAFSLVKLWGINLPAIYLFAYVLNLGPTGIWLAIVAEYVISFALIAAWYTRGTWKAAVITDTGTTSTATD